MTYSIFDIHAWQKAYEFTLLTYKATKKFPDFEKYGLASQFQRVAVSIVANIAEGSRKTSKPDKLKFMNIAQGSLEECRCYVLLAKDLEYISTMEHDALTACLEDTSRLLNAFTKGIETHDFNSQI
ncbi:four helix bundle protein [Prevotella sp. KH2C16]|uniref:four helix bundle protein n=1 Tax=Prevotella sp. KH2C16 TaxID=1855325 RepID=UPI0008E44980|nr:four helix bundle protein [Prevotella sp. KH2C16]SFG39789.1 four helix bundle protein [Prevotella sp. KH2C16]